MSRLPVLLALAGTAAVAAPATALAPQLPGGTYVVASDQGAAATPGTRLLVADPGGSTTTIPGFPSDGLRPQAVTVDTLTDDLLVVVANPSGSGRALRLQLSGQTVLGEVVLGDFPGPVNDVVVAYRGDIYGAVTGTNAGVWRMPRRGGAAVLVRAFTEPTAMSTFGPEATWITVADSGTAGPPARDLRLVSFDLASGAGATVVNYPGYQPAAVVGMVDLPTGIPRTLFTHPDGTVSLSEAWQNPVPLQVQNFGAGSTRTVVWDPSGRLVVLGGQAHPFIKSLPAIPPTGQPVSWTILAGRLQGDPVDMELVPAQQAGLIRFGTSCSSAPMGPAMAMGMMGQPTVGNPNFALTLQNGTPSSVAFLALGFREDVGAGTVALPFALPSGCELLVDPEGLSLAMTSSAGFASQGLAIPNNPALIGQWAYAQWLQWPGVPFDTSAAAAIQIGQ